MKTDLFFLLVQQSFCKTFVRKLGLAAFSALTVLSAQTINLSGTVTDCSGEPVGGADVTLASYDLTTRADSEGMYEIIHTVGVRDRAFKNYPFYSLSRRELAFSLTSSKPAEVTLHTLNGRLIAHIRSYPLHDGEHRLTLPVLESGLYFLTLSNGDNQFVYKLVSASSGSFAMTPVMLSGHSQNTLPLAKPSAEGDTLAVSAAGFRTSAVPLDSLSGTVDVALMTEAEFVEGEGACPVKEWKIVFMGQKESQFMVLPDGTTMMIDSGGDINLTIDMMRRHGITHLDYYVETHRHGDHNGGRDELEDAGFKDNETVHWECTTVERGDEYDIGGAHWYIYNASPDGGGGNSDSISWRAIFNGFIYSGSGDEGTGSMDWFLREKPELVEAHIRLCAHHAWGPGSYDFLIATNAYIYVASQTLGDFYNPGSASQNVYADAMEEMSKTGRLMEDGFILAQEHGAVYVRAASGEDWSYEFCPDDTIQDCKFW